ncbi:TolB family protein [Actinoplanes sp. NPDC048988]|uniref:TolB family protein n=1 Tax=Actinoplanes sp. NPDC048988 TaxID=3363901 RepID=UPI00371A5470
MIVAGAITAFLAGMPAVASAAPSAQPQGRLLFIRTVDSPRGSGPVQSVRPDGSALTDLNLNVSWYSSPDYSPDGQRIAYVTQGPDDFFPTVYTAAADGTGAQPFSQAPCGPSSPRWSPNGTTIGFEACGDIYKRDFGGPLTPITGANNDGTNLSFSWAPQGKRIATAGRVDPGLHVWKADGSASRQVSDLSTADDVDWNPKSSKLAVSSGDDLWFVDATTGAKKQVTNTPDVAEDNVVWSADGKWLAYSESEVQQVTDPDSGESYPVRVNPQVYVVDAAGKHRHAVGVPGIPTSWRAQS